MPMPPNRRARRTCERPSAPVLHHLASLAATSAALLAHLLSGGAGASGGASGGSGEEAWLKLFLTPLADFDAFLLLRKEALPRADQVRPAVAGALTWGTWGGKGRGGGQASGGVCCC